MRSLTSWCAGTIAWEFALPNLGRLYAPLEVGFYTSAFAAAAALTIVLMPSFRRVKHHWLALALVGSFCAVRWLTTGHILKIILSCHFTSSHSPRCRVT